MYFQETGSSPRLGHIIRHNKGMAHKESVNPLSPTATGLVRSLLGEAWELRLRQPERGLQVVGEALSLLPAAPNDASLRLIRARALAIRATCLERLSRYPDALADAEAALEMLSALFALAATDAERSEIALEQSNACKAKANSLRHTGHLDKALAVMEQEQVVLQHIADPALREGCLASTCNNMAGLYNSLGEYGLCLEYALASLDTHRRNKHAWGEGSALMYIGHAQVNLDDPDAGLASYRAALAIFEQEGSLTWQCGIRCGIADALMTKGDYDGAEALLRENGRASQTQNDISTDIVTYANWGVLWQRRGDLPRALRATRYSQRLSRRIGNRHHEAEAYLAIAEMYEARGRNVRARKNLSAGVALAEAVGMQKQIATGHERLSLLCEKDGDAAQALLHYRRFHEVWAALYNEASDRRLRRLQVEYDTKNARREAEVSRQHAAFMERLAHTDKLTGLANRGWLQEQLGAEFEQARRDETAFSVAICDIDRFKAVNDTFGHPVGDAVIIEVGRILESVAAEAPGASVGRWGGEEFVLLFPGLAAGEAAARCEQCRRVVEAADWHHIAPRLHVTISLGVCGDECIKQAGGLVARADEKLYEAKQTGRNRMCV